MPRSLSARLSILTTTMIALAFLGGAIVVHRSTSSAFVEREDLKDVEAESVDVEGRTDRLLDELSRADREHGWDGVRRLAEDLAAIGFDPPPRFVVVRDDGSVVATSGPDPTDVEARWDDEGAVHLTLRERTRDSVEHLELADPDPLAWRSRSGEMRGRLVLLPEPPDPRRGSRFAFDVWRSAWPWLLAVILLAVGATSLLLRRALGPIDRLTNAARELKEGRIPARLGSVREVEFRSLVEAFDAAVDAVERTEELRRRLIADVSHELRTPVANVRSQLEACESGLLPLEPSLLDTLRSESRLLERLVEDLHQLAVSDAGQLRLHLQEVPLAETAAETLQPLAEASGAHCKIRIQEELKVLADEERLHQILVNLFENAARQGGPGVSIGLTAEELDGRVVLRFEDDGPGIPAADRPHVFDRFYRAEKSRNRATGGSGLGLSIVKGFLEAMGGSVRCEEAPGGGAAFVLELPAWDSEASRS